MKNDTLTFKVVTPEGTIINELVTFVKLPGITGEMGILPEHSPLLAELDIGKIRVHKANGDMVRFFVSEGFAQVMPDEVMVMTESLERAEDIDIEKAKKEKKEALEELNIEDKKEDKRKARKKLRRSAARIYIHSIHFGPSHPHHH
ncbi:MAG: ATP synthase F1 subunit epsilon [bacterium]|nr:ATP synthase F1 subunit epsilon [bacterium]